MEKADFKIPERLEVCRIVILKGKVYEFEGTIVMAEETTCSFTKKVFKGICVGIKTGASLRDIYIIGSKGKWSIKKFGDDKGLI